jgi:hypothetical protein
MDAYVKTPAETVRVTIDMRQFVIDADPVPVSFSLRSDLGIVITDQTTLPGLIELDVSGGNTGRVYVLGVEATTTDGQSEVVTRRIRLREVDLWPGLPVAGPIGTPGVSSSQYADSYADSYA